MATRNPITAEQVRKVQEESRKSSDVLGIYGKGKGFKLDVRNSKTQPGKLRVRFVTLTPRCEEDGVGTLKLLLDKKEFEELAETFGISSVTNSVANSGLDRILKWGGGSMQVTGRVKQSHSNALSTSLDARYGIAMINDSKGWGKDLSV